MRSAKCEMSSRCAADATMTPNAVYTNVTKEKECTKALQMQYMYMGKERTESLRRMVGRGTPKRVGGRQVGAGHAQLRTERGAIAYIVFVRWELIIVFVRSRRVFAQKSRRRLLLGDQGS